MTDEELNRRFDQLEGRVLESIRGSEARTLETMRDMQTEILRGLEGFARGNFSRMHTLESASTDTNTRIAALEERVLYLETRRQ